MMRRQARRLIVLFSVCFCIGGAGIGRAEAPPIVFPEDAGVVDVTQPPYHAAGDGVTDDTAAINAALRDHNLGTFEGNVTFIEDPETGERIRKNSAGGRPGEAWTVYLPEGTYRVSDTLIPRDPYDPAMSQSTVRLIGAGVGRTVIRLADKTPGYGRPGRPKNVVQTGNAFGAKANSGFGNYVQHLTIDVGCGNPGAVGIQFDVANMGAIDHVRIVSSDPARAGWAGLAFYNIAGAGLVKNLDVEGFDYGIFLGTGDVGVNNIAFENIRLSGQRQAGLFNRGKNIQVHRLRSANDVPALRTALPYTATILVDAEMQGPGEGPAVEMMEPSFLHVRDLTAKGYDTTIETGDGAPKPDVTDSAIDEWWTHDAPYQTPETASLRLPIKMTPEYHHSDLGQWANVTAFGATVNDDRDDDAPGIQAAIDSGKPVVYFPKGDYTIRSDIVVRGGVRKIDFLFSRLSGERPGDDRLDPPVVRVEEVDAETMILANVNPRFVNLVHDSAATVAVQNCGTGPGTVETGPNATGDFFLENTGPHILNRIGPGVHGWCRQINRERGGFLNDGGTVWYFADNIEAMVRPGTGKRWNRPTILEIQPLRTVNGGRTEVIGGAMDAMAFVHKPEEGPLIDADETSQVSAVYAGELRTRDGVRGYWPLHIRDALNGSTNVVGGEDVLYLPQGQRDFSAEGRPDRVRVVVPLYSTPR
jgi:hypothetical protein